MEDLVREFNRLPRPATTPDGLPNHWIFTVRRLEVADPPGDVLIIFYAPSYYLAFSEIKSLPSSIGRAEAVVPLLSKAVVEGNMNPKIGSRHADFDDFKGIAGTAPWTWCCDEPELVKSVDAELHMRGVRHELCNVGVATPAEVQAFDQFWTASMAPIVKKHDDKKLAIHAAAAAAGYTQPAFAGVGDEACHGCGTKRDDTPTALMRCARCARSWYCSKKCQSKNWKMHKKAVCFVQETDAISFSTEELSSAIDAREYYHVTANTNPSAKTLAALVGLVLPTTKPASCDILLVSVLLHILVEKNGLITYRHPLRRLIVTGKDTAENMRLLFGPLSSKLMFTHREIRLQVLLDSPTGSMTHSWATIFGLDKGCPVWSPGPATEAEQRDVKKIRHMQSAMRTTSVDGKPLNSTTMRTVFEAFADRSDVAHQHMLDTLAVNTLNQGLA
ncbi:hypothetical protein LTR49_018013 [Elasticomyces elasticus]|nr:hypothetical protein LTR49_018013 [Elasticomyces elasticus]